MLKRCKASQKSPPRPFFGLPIDFSITLEYLRPSHHQHPGLLSSDLLCVTPRTLDEDLMFHHIRPIVGFYTDDDDEAAQRIPGRRISVYSNNEVNLKLFEEWIQESFGNDESAYGDVHDLPKRVLDVSNSGESGKVYLKEFDAPTQGRYVALSHCWGKSLLIQTTTEHILEHFRCISIAGMSADGLKGCFAARDSPSGPYCALDMLSHRDQRPVTLYFTLDLIGPPIRGSNAELPLDKSPLHKRGWTFQEVVLAPRYLSFELTQVYFRCDKFVAFETGRRLDVSHYYVPEGKYLLERRMWMTIVSHYTSRDLTFETDKLPALSGLSHEYQRMWNATYYAGMWKSSLCKDLMWFLSSAGHTKPSTYRAPSWSWASVNGPISYQPPLSWGASCVDLRHAYVKPKGTDPMGEVIFGTLILSAHVQILSTQNGQSWEEILRPNGQGSDLYTSIRLDFRRIEDVSDMWLVYITEGEGLTLRRASMAKETYERVGIFRKGNVEDVKNTGKQMAT